MDEMCLQVVHIVMRPSFPEIPHHVIEPEVFQESKAIRECYDKTYSQARDVIDVMGEGSLGAEQKFPWRSDEENSCLESISRKRCMITFKVRQECVDVEFLQVRRSK